MAPLNSLRPRPRGAGARRGHALLLVLLLGALFAGMWITVHRATRDASTVRVARAQREVFEERILRALAYTAALLETSAPQQPNHAFVYAGVDARGPFHTTVRLARAPQQAYDVSAEPASQQEIASLQHNPQTF